MASSFSFSLNGSGIFHFMANIKWDETTKFQSEILYSNISPAILLTKSIARENSIKVPHVHISLFVLKQKKNTL